MTLPSSYPTPDTRRLYLTCPLVWNLDHCNIYWTMGVRTLILIGWRDGVDGDGPVVFKLTTGV